MRGEGERNDIQSCKTCLTAGISALKFFKSYSNLASRFATGCCCCCCLFPSLCCSPSSSSLSSSPEFPGSGNDEDGSPVQLEFPDSRNSIRRRRDSRSSMVSAPVVSSVRGSIIFFVLSLLYSPFVSRGIENQCKGIDCQNCEEY